MTEVELREVAKMTDEELIAEIERIIDLMTKNAMGRKDSWLQRNLDKHLEELTDIAYDRGIEI